MNAEEATLRREIDALQKLIDGFPDRHRLGLLGATYSARLAQLHRGLVELGQGADSK